MTVRYYHVAYEFRSESTLYSCLNVKELPARSKQHIWSLTDSNRIRTHNHLVRKRTLIHLAKLAKWFSCVVRTYLYSQMHRTQKYSPHSSIICPVWRNGWVFVYELKGCGFESRCCHFNFRYGAFFDMNPTTHVRQVKEKKPDKCSQKSCRSGDHKFQPAT